MAQGIHDISVLLGPDTVPWPGMSPVAARSISADVARGDSWTGSSWQLNSHVGTHVDAPTHFLPDGLDIAKTHLEHYFGRCVVADFTHVTGRDIEASDLVASSAIQGHTRVLFKTSNSLQLLELDHFDTSYVALAQSAAEYLVKHRVILAGIDYQGIDRFDAPGNPTHHTLLASNCAILEGADLRAVEPGEYVLVCLPLRLQEGDASPVRAVLVDPSLIDRLRRQFDT